MGKWYRVTVVALAALGVLAVLFGAGAYVYWHNLGRIALPAHAGEWHVDGLQGRVEVLRDDHGVPHIYAKNRRDLFFTQGYVQAQDRWWQMDLMRHAGNGRLTELLGKRARTVATDVLARTLQFREVAEAEYALLSDEGKAVLEAFAEGVNAYINSREPHELAMEYGVLRLTGLEFEIEPWTPVDSLVMTRLLALDLSKNRNRELMRAAVQESVSSELAELYAPTWPGGDRATIIEEDDLPAKGADREARLATPPLSDETLAMARSHPLYDGMFFGRPESNGSNNWVIGGELTATGDPILANDPHLGVQLPSIWYEVNLNAPDFRARGFALPGAPLVIIGHNGTIAWGITNGGSDCQDHYALELNPDDPHQYRWEQRWRDFDVEEHTLDFNDGSSPLTFQIRRSHLGPIVNENRYDAEAGRVTGHNLTDPLALRWTGLEPARQFDAVLDYNEAQSWDEFVAALEHWETPSQNFVYADNKGNIGYIFAGKVPIRRKPHDGLTPAPGTKKAFEWAGFLEYDELPRLFNPDKGYIATANQMAVPESYLENLRAQYGDDLYIDINSDTGYFGYRGGRIHQLIERTHPHQLETSKTIQADVFSESARDTVPFILRLSYGDIRFDQTREWLTNWDHHFRDYSKYAAFYGAFWRALMKQLFNDQLPASHPASGVAQEMWAVKHLLREPDHPWWDDARTDDTVETRDDIIRRAFFEAHRELENRFDRLREDWRWGDLHTVHMVNAPLGASGIGPVENAVNRGPYPVGGSAETVHRMRWVAEEGYGVLHTASMRMIIDAGDFSRSVAINSTGQSGHPASTHYDDQIRMWLDNEYKPMHYTREAVEDATTALMVLTPSVGDEN